MRKDGKKIRGGDPMAVVGAYIMDKRIDAMNMITINLPAEPMQEYINRKRKEGINISHMALILAAYTRTVAEFPELNRFIVNKKLYARNEIAVAMVVLKDAIKDHGTMSKMYFKPENTLFEVNDIINKYVEDNRNEPDNVDTEKFMKALLSVPGVLPVGVALFKLMDRWGILPKSIIDVSPFHASLLISNLASIRTNHIYHHVYEFGTTSIGVTIGTSHVVPKLKGKEVVYEKCIPLGVTMDERICSGNYFAIAFRRMQQLLKNPELMEVPPETVVRDPNVKYKEKKVK